MFRLARHGGSKLSPLKAHCGLSHISIRRYVDGHHGIDIDALRSQLTGRTLPLTYDYLSPQPSHLLNLSLEGCLTSTPSNADSSWAKAHTLPSIAAQARMPPGHHLVYFPPQVSAAQLLKDGTDVLHYPGKPWDERLWAGGYVQFGEHDGPLLNGSRAVLLEGIRDVFATGKEGEEKVFVGIERRVAVVKEGEDEGEIRRRLWTEQEENLADACLIERRNLVFKQSRAGSKRDGQSSYTSPENKPRRMSTATQNPEFCHAFIPTKSLLFRFSALTFNAHSIHLDREYARGVEGFPDLLVHGPLTLVLMLTVLRNYLAKAVGKDVAITRMEYRNLMPLFVEREMKICGRPKKSGKGWDVWIQNENGEMAVKGTAWTRLEGMLEPRRE
ncbi:hypothetical protein KEM55_003097 [Ascosphaera atra]|nr:hypothetical protein KEM55_003097 [Ascosphaera atra]